MYRNDTPFVVKGGSGYARMTMLKAIGGNTVRTWDTAGLGAILDSAAANNLAVIAGLYIPESRYFGLFYNDQKKVDEQYAALRQVIQRYRSHPALLMWCLGNEVDFPFKARYNKFYDAYNRLLNMIHTEDPDHPVTTTMVNYQFRNIINIRLKVKGIDIISFNTFGDLQKLKNNLSSFSWFWKGPFLITEWGIYSPQESVNTAWGVPIEPTSTKKAAQYREMYTRDLPVDNPRFLGALTFYWGQKEEVTPTWYSILDDSGGATAMVREMQSLWTGATQLREPPELEYMLVNGKGAADNIIMKPGTMQTAEVRMIDPLTKGLRIVWKVLDEDFDPQNMHQPKAYMVDLTPGDSLRVTFRAPSKEGPYRIYSWIYDDDGNVATANTPFYVVGI
ncbi:glycoside hydrolase family 2 TIM barrel-domain containing protein [Chitinophaga sp. S165]|uniref:glycoside hydrolase family 2 TIM barrel-domain containing protein n=1 Tax=Chitinophaga sp. S165 TaxID=2135462 RepID=UPI0013048600|nr:glycoside hydrolase family 2 TIM barrel-domain containing protein [Chitinophaga sp. S165]